MRPSIRAANIAFLVVLVLALTAGAWFQSYSFMLGVAATELWVVLTPTLLVLAGQRLSLRQGALLAPVSLRVLLLSGVVGLLGWPLAGVLGLLSELVLGLVGPLPEPIIPPIGNEREAAVYLLLLCLMAPLCEELLARGLLQRAYERQGIRRSIWYGALFFGLFHLSPVRFLPTAFLGWVLGQVYARSRSLVAPMLAHAANNFVAFVLLVVVEQSPQSPQSLPPDLAVMAVGIACMLAMSLAIAPLLAFSLRAIGRLPEDDPQLLPVSRPLWHWTFVGTALVFALSSGLELAVRAGLLGGATG